VVASGDQLLVVAKSALEAEANMGRKNNQQFVQLPLHARFINQLTYKAQLVGIRLSFRKSYTTNSELFG